jgi:hypothetical protein
VSRGTSERLKEKSGSHFSGRYDDQVDALLLFLDWFAANEDPSQSVLSAGFLSRAPTWVFHRCARDWSCRY